MSGKRVLIVEDEMLISMSLEDALIDYGFSVAGIAYDLDSAFSRLASSPFDVALLDINLGRDQVWPFARELCSRGIAFAFLSSDCVRDDFPLELSHAPRMCKPFDEAEVFSVLKSLTVAKCA